MSLVANVGILTLHYGFNEGAILQAYGVTQLVHEHLPGSSARIIDQRYPGKLRAYGPANNDRKRALLDAIDHWLPLSEQRFRTENTEMVLRYVQETFDLVVMGSDVIWNLRYRPRFSRLFSGGLGYTQTNPFFPAFPNVYWPGDTVRVPKVAYAASVGTLTWSTIPSRHRRQMRKILTSFTAISVRDERTHRFLDWLDPALADRAVLVPDPTLGVSLLNPARVASVRAFLKERGVDFDRPRCGIICGPHAQLEAAMTKLRKRGYQIIGITTPNTYSDIPLFDQPFHPLDWAVLFQLMDVCVVDRMHGSIFCIQNHAPFVALDSYETEQDNDSKTRSLMRRFGLTDFCVSKARVTAGELLERIKALEQGAVEWGRIDKELEQCRQDAGAFFQTFAESMEMLPVGRTK